MRDKERKHADAEAAQPTIDGRKPVGSAVQSCIAGFFGEGSFVGSLDADVRFLCEDRDFRGVNSLLERILISHGAGEVTPAMMEWSNLGWYQMGATAVIRGACCPPHTAAIKLPRAPSPCDQLDDTLQRVAETGTTGNSEELAKAYSQAVYCFYLTGVPHSYHYRKPPGPSSRWQFVSFLQHAHR